MLGGIAEWDPAFATAQLLWLLAAPIFIMLPNRRRTLVIPRRVSKDGLSMDWLLATLVGGTSLVVSAGIGAFLGDLPPAYHDEYSYLFQSKTLLLGHFSVPSAAIHPELFDQMHVLNEGRMASRYYPGTGLWLAPFVAMGHPYWGPRLATALATMLTYWTGRELGGRLSGCLAGLAMALSPGVGLFGNTLLSHPPTLVGLGLFFLGMIRLRRTRSGWDGCLAGCGLSYAMICRPMTAAGVGLPFGIDLLWWLFREHQSPASHSIPKDQIPRTIRIRRLCILMGLGLPLICGWLIMLAYNHGITGAWLRSPYQLYTDTYTPRHVYGFNNVVRGEQQLGPKVIEHYDRWAENLTTSLAVSNATNRWFASWIWTLDVLPLLLTSVIVLGTAYRLDRRWLLLGGAILSLHLIHIPYWYVGIMGWHYVFESAPIWCLLLAAATQRLLTSWHQSRLYAMPRWWIGLVGLSIAGSYYAPARFWKPRIQNAIGSLAYPRHQQANFRRWVNESIPDRPALVLVDQRESEASHLDFVHNDPGLSSEIIYGRLPSQKAEVMALTHDITSRTIFVVSPARRTITRLSQ